ncbi:MAG: hypothetical protein K0V04_26080, partial [Deltaproteobacteria bacterium]|nr:hypothetical protein [Deltaproteobacteria bacterium]
NDDVTDRGIAWTDVEALEDEYGPVEHSGPDSVTFRVKSGGESCTLKECGTACGAFGCNGASVEGGGDTCQCSAC